MNLDRTMEEEEEKAVEDVEEEQDNEQKVCESIFDISVVIHFTVSQILNSDIFYHL